MVEKRPETPNFLEQKESLPYRERTLVAFGGTSGTGLSAAGEFAKLGGRVIVVTSDPQLARYDSSLSLITRLGIPTERFSPAAANLKQPDQIDALAKTLKREGVRPTDILLSAAGGMDEFAGDFLLEMLEINAMLRSNLSDDEKDRNIKGKIAEIRKKLEEEWLPASYENAVAVNYRGQVNTIETFAKHFPKGFSLVFYNSIFGHIGEGPLHYRNVLTKKMTSNWLKVNAENLAERDIYTSEIVAPVIGDTKVGKVITRYMSPLFPASLQERINDTTVTRKDVVEATRSFWDLTPQEHARNPTPDTIFVTRHQGNLLIARELPAELTTIDVSQFPF